MLGVEVGRLQVGALLWRAWALTEECLLVELDRNQACLQQFLAIKKLRDDVEWVPSYRSIGGWFDKEKLTHQELWDWIKECLEEGVEEGVEEIVQDFELPVCYELGLDWDRIEEVSGRSRAEWIAQHSAGRYQVAAIGFLPGFVFLDGLDDALQMPRLERPRTKIPEGTVGIGGHQTGWYAIESPGGWNSIGRTPRPLLDLGQTDGSPIP
ncbi:MAG: carboxyltransferase domain-containing protein, partial [Bacteroidota bacterium]